jgi:hypothetical protein
VSVSYPLEVAQQIGRDRTDLRAALRHQVLRNHPFNPLGCSACEDAEVALASEGSVVAIPPALENPACSNCGGLTQRTGACFTCLTCATSTGCG